MKFEIFFSRIRKLDLDMIWDHDRYVKASPGSTLHIPNNGLTICGDLGRKSGIFSFSKEIRYKKRFGHFFEKNSPTKFRAEKMGLFITRLLYSDLAYLAFSEFFNDWWLLNMLTFFFLKFSSHESFHTVRLLIFAGLYLRARKLAVS